MKKVSILILALSFIFTAAKSHAQDYVHTQTLEGHTSTVESVIFTDNTTLISGSQDRTFRSWNLDTGKQHWSKNVNSYYAKQIAIPLHNPRFIAYSTNRSPGNLEMRYTSDGDFRGRLNGHKGQVYGVAFKPKSYLLASGGADNTIRIWDTSWGDWKSTPVRTLRGHTDAVYSVAWSPDGQTLASGSMDGTVRLWNPNNGINFAVLRGHRSSIYSVAWSPDGQTFASGSTDNTVRIWDIDTERTLYVLQRRNISSPNYSLAWHPNGELLAAARGAGQIDLWNPNNGTHIVTLMTQGVSVKSVVWNPNGEVLAAGQSSRIYIWEAIDADVTGNGTVTVWDIREVAHPDNYNKSADEARNPKTDVNKDGMVNIEDLILVAKAVDAVMGVSGAPPLVQHRNPHEMPADENAPGIPFTAAEVQQWIADAKAHGINAEGIAALESLLAALTQPQAEALPKQTQLLANYPNPFNPETWIPYQLAQAAEVSVEIHAADGTLVRSLALGQLPAGVYQSKQRAAYWDGQNKQGEPVASGLYFYTLKAGEFSATRKMLIRK